jgi:hypothetical protein
MQFIIGKPSRFRLFGGAAVRLLGVFSLLVWFNGQVGNGAGLPVSLAANPAVTTTISVCDQAHLLAALNIGGDINFSCSGTITLTSTPVGGIVIAVDTTLDGSGQNVIIDGGGTRGIFTLSTAGLTLTLKNLTLSHAGGGSEAIINPSATLNIINTTFSNNNGAIANGQGNLNITSSLFISNTTSGDGGAISNSGTVTIMDSTFTGNSDPGSFGLEGGAIFNGGVGNMTVRNSTFNANNVGVQNSFGGAIANDNFANLIVINSTFYGNGGGLGAAIFSPGPSATIINSTIVANGAANNMGAVVFGENVPGSLNIVNSIIANNPAGNCGGSPIGGHNNLETGNVTTCGTNSILADPMLGPLANNGGPTQTLALPAGSQAIDKADNAICQMQPPNGAGNLDQRGVARPQGNGCDIGAFELAPLALAAPSSLKASTFSPTRIDLSWQDNSSNETGFSLERKTGAGGVYAQVANLPANTITFSDTTVAADTTYFYRVQALQNGLASDFSNEISITSGAANLVVTLATDDGSGAADSLSKALNSANSGQVITFNLNGGANSIAVSGQLPSPKAGVSLDGGSCTAGAGGGPRITLDGTGTSPLINGLQLNKGAMLRNLRLKGFGGRQLVVQGGAGSFQPQCVVATSR